MKKNALLLLCIIVMLIPTMGFKKLPSSLSHLIFRNNTGKTIIASYAYFDPQEKCWISKGWYSLEPYSSHEIVAFNYPTVTRVYIHGEREGFIEDTEWGGSYSFCVDPKSAFTILFADQNVCKRKATFSSLQLDPGDNKWTFNP